MTEIRAILDVVQMNVRESREFFLPSTQQEKPDVKISVP